MAKSILITTERLAEQQTKVQKAFYSNIKKLESLKKTIEDTRNMYAHFTQQKEELLIIAEKENAVVQVEWLKALYRWRTHPSIPRDLVQIITKTIVEEAFQLIEDFGYEDLIPMYDECSDIDYETERAEQKSDEAEMLREVFSKMGIDIDGDITEENLYEHLANAKEKLEQQTEQQQAERLERAAKKKKTAKQQAALDAKEAQKQIETKSIREIYKTLAKQFHPDTEPDETERTRKTEVMQRITAAYEKNDLLELLRLQLEYEQISIDKLDSLADAQLAAYNNVLKEQLKQLQQEYNVGQQFFYGQNPMLPPYIRLTSKIQIDAFIKQELRKLQLTKKQVEDDIVQLVDTPTVARKYLKRLKKEDEQESHAFANFTNMFNIKFGM